MVRRKTNRKDTATKIPFGDPADHKNVPIFQLSKRSAGSPRAEKKGYFFAEKGY